MADALLRFDRMAGRWEYSVGDIAAWTNTENTTALLQIARNATGRPVGFTFDVDVSDPAYAESLNAILREFGDALAQRVSGEPTEDVELLISTSSSLAESAEEGVDIMRQNARLQRASSDVVITDDSAAGIVTVTMTVPWWARFTKPWVAVRRRGKRDILLTGPMRVRGRTAKATLRYGMPYSGSTLTADVVKGPRSKTWVPIVAAMFAATLLVFGLVQDGTEKNSAGGSASPTSALPTSVASIATGTSVPTPSTTLPVSPTSALTTSTSSSTVAPATTRPPGGIEVKPSRECNGSFCVLGVSFERVSSCMQAGDTFVQRGDGFWPEYGLPYVYFIPGIVQPPLPGGPVLRMPVTVVSQTELRGVIPQASEFPVPPVAGQMVSIVVVNGEYGVSPWGSTWSKWCG